MRYIYPNEAVISMQVRHRDDKNSRLNPSDDDEYDMEFVALLRDALHNEFH
jgi:hypothetical protein